MMDQSQERIREARVVALYSSGRCPCRASIPLVNAVFMDILQGSPALLNALVEADGFFPWAAWGDPLDPRGLPPT